jgi:hypothetical protein
VLQAAARRRGMDILDTRIKKNKKHGAKMKRLLLILMAAGLLFSFSFADTSTDNNAASNLQLFKDHTEGIINFINAGQNRDVSRQVDYQIPSNQTHRANKGNKNIVKQIVVQPVATFAPQKYDFSNTTPYGDFKVLVIQDSENTFQVTFSSDDPVERYQLYDTTTKAISTQENLNDKKVYSFTVYKKFEPKYVLLLAMEKDDFLSQNIIPLYKKDTIKYK